MYALAFLLALALASRAAASSDTCVAPYAGQNVSSFVCSQAGATLSLARSPRWDANFGGQIVVTGTSLCLNVSGVVLSDGEPAITLAPCDAGSPITPFQLFAPLASGANSSYASHVDGSCLDLVSGTEGPNEQLELYGCSGNPNQCVDSRAVAAAASSLFTHTPAAAHPYATSLRVFTFTGGQMVVSAWGYCVGVCA